MHKDKWLLLAILCLIVGIIEGYNLHKTVAKHRKASASVSVSTQKQEVSDTRQPVAQPKNNENKASAKASRSSEKENIQQAQRKDTSSPVLSAEQGREPKSPKKAKAVLTRFTYQDTSAKEVTFHGSWSGKSYPMTLKNGVWTFEARLNPAEYAYHFRVDGVKKVNKDKPVNAAGDNVVKVLPAE